MLIPSVDLVKGRAVQLRQGEELELVADEDPRDLVRRFGRIGEVAVIDLDAARGTGDNLALIEELCALAPCRVGGGIRDVERGQRLLRAGARRIIIGTMAEPEFLENFPRGRVIAAVDSREDRVVDRGWRRRLDESPIERARRLEPHVGGFLYTVVEREGTESGLDVARVTSLREAVEKPVTAAGGVRSVDEIVVFDRLGVDLQVGMALYKGTITPGEAFAAVMDFTKDDPRVPTVVQDARDGRVLMVAHSTRATLTEAITTGDVILWSRRRGRWRKGEESGNTQRLVRVEADCDRDALLFLVEPGGPACHRGTASCFGERPFSLATLEAVIAERAAAAEDGSYTKRLLSDPVARRAKVLEEANELVDADTYAEVRWEAADLLYHTLVKLAAHGVPLAAVIAELESRRRRPAE
jgi:phosphoribosyl-AMP cyclohydrolase / phosphoribosyl-ATP pyrophosphohydrolase